MADGLKADRSRPIGESRARTCSDLRSPYLTAVIVAERDTPICRPSWSMSLLTDSRARTLTSVDREDHSRVIAFGSAVNGRLYRRRRTTVADIVSRWKRCDGRYWSQFESTRRVLRLIWKAWKMGFINKFFFFLFCFKCKSSRNDDQEEWFYFWDNNF